MQIKVSDYIANFIAEQGISTIFTVVGGGAMHLNDSFGHHEGLRCVYNHHEQASTIAAEAYFKVSGTIAACCVTSGPGAINALNGVVGAYQDSIPMIVFSGQCKTSLMASYSGLQLRTMGPQEYDIVPTLQNATKYSVTVKNKNDIRKCLEKAFIIAKSGRPGPCWLEIPVDVQGAVIDTDNLEGYQVDIDEYKLFVDQTDLDDILDDKISTLINKIIKAKRPIIYAGNGIRISGAADCFIRFVEKYRIPVVTCWDSIDLISTDNEFYVGRAGTMGDRAGNFAVQNSDLIISIGSRLNIYQVGYDVSTWAREAYVAAVDIDPLELKKPTIRVDLPICADARNFIEKMLQLSNFVDKSDWLDTCSNWKKRYPVVNKKQLLQKNQVNVYALMDILSRSLPEGMVTVVANGSASVVGSASYYIGKKQRFIMNCGLSSMGYDLPAAIGAAVADGSQVLCIAGDGSIMMNLQELQTIVSNNLPIKIVIINNQGYHQIRQTQTNLFNSNFVGLGPDSGDLSFPDFEKIAFAFGIPFQRCMAMNELQEDIEWLLGNGSYAVLEVMCDIRQCFEPKSSSKKLDDGTIISPPLEDLAPFLSREELRDNMMIDMIGE